MSESIAVAGAPRELAPLLRSDPLTRLKQLRLNRVLVIGTVLLIITIAAALAKAHPKGRLMGKRRLRR